MDPAAPVPDDPAIRAEVSAQVQRAGKCRRHPTTPLKGKVALVTGASGGIGEALAPALAGSGAAVAGGSGLLQGGQNARRVVEEITAEGGGPAL